MTTRAADLEALLQRLSDELEEASNHLRLQPEWKDASAFTVLLEPRLEEALGDPEACDDACRELEAQLDLLALGRDRSRKEEKRLAAEKAARREEDRAVMAGLVSSLKWYGWLVAASFVLTPFAGVFWGRLVVLAALPAAMGYARMLKAREPTVGRHWVILRGDVDVVLERAEFYDKAAALAVATPLLWLIASNVLSG